MGTVVIGIVVSVHPCSDWKRWAEMACSAVTALGTFLWEAVRCCKGRGYHFHELPCTIVVEMPVAPFGYCMLGKRCARCDDGSRDASGPFCLSRFIVSDGRRSVAGAV